MSRDLKQDIDHFFRVFEGRTEELFASLPKLVKEDLEEEIGLLRTSIRNRLDEEART